MVALSGKGEWAEKLSIITIFRFVRLVRLIRICTERKQLETAARQMVSQNKRRYQQDGYDLDLTYVTKRVIATSFPSTGVLALYRYSGCNLYTNIFVFLGKKVVNILNSDLGLIQGRLTEIRFGGKGLSACRNFS